MAYASVTEYTTAQYIVNVNFPKDKIACTFCPYKRYRDVGKTTRFICSLTYEGLEDVANTIGHDCPLKFEEEG